jgi:hypothetical protein
VTLLIITACTATKLLAWNTPGTVYITPAGLCQGEGTGACTFAFTPQNAGDPIVVGMLYGGTGSTSQKTISSVSDDGSGGGSTWGLSTCPGATCTQGYVSAHSSDMAYTLSAAPAMGHITVNVSGFSGSAVPWQIYAIELRPSYPPAFLDTSGSVDDSSSATSWAGVALSPTGNDTIIQILHAGLAVNAVTSNPSGTNYSSNISHAGSAIAAYSINTSVGTAPTFGYATSGPSSSAAGSAMAFGEQQAPIPLVAGPGIIAQNVSANGIVISRPVATVSITTTSPLPNCTYTVPFTFSFNATGGIAPYTWSLYSGSLQPGLSLASTGVLSGTCTNSSGSVSFMVQVCDSEASPACTTGSFSQTAQNTPPPTLVVCDSSSSPTCPNPPATGVTGTFYSYSFSAIGGTAPYSWTVSSGNIPTGLTLTSAGVLSGFPSMGGTFSYTVEVTDSTSPTPATATASFTTTISGYTGAPTLAKEPQSWTTAHQAAQNLSTGNTCAQTDATGVCAWGGLPKTCNAANHCIHEQLGFGSNDHPATMQGLYLAGCDWISALGSTYSGQQYSLWVEVPNQVFLGSYANMVQVYAFDGSYYVDYLMPAKMAGLTPHMMAGQTCAAPTNTPIGPYTLAGSLSGTTPFILGEQVKQQTTNAQANLLYVACTAFTFSTGVNAPWNNPTSTILPNCADTGDAQTGPFSIGMLTGGSGGSGPGGSDNTHNWIGQTSGAVFAPSAYPVQNGYFRVTGKCSPGTGSGSPLTPGYPLGSSDTPCNNLTDQVPCFHSILDSSIDWNPLCSGDLSSMWTLETTINTDRSTIIQQDGDNTSFSGVEVTFLQGQNQSLSSTVESTYGLAVQNGLSPQLVQVNCGSCGRDHYWAHGWDPGDPALHTGDPSQLSAAQGYSYPVTPGTSPAQYNCPSWSFQSTYQTPGSPVMNPPIALTSSSPAPYNQVQYANGCGDDVQAGVVLSDGGYGWDEFFSITKIHKYNAESHTYSIGNAANNLNPNGAGINGPHKWAQFLTSGTSEEMFFGGTPVNPVSNVAVDEEVRNFRFAPDPGYRYLTGAGGHSPLAAGGFGCSAGTGSGLPNICAFAWAMKKCFEIKWGLRIMVNGGVFENMWPDGQTGECVTADVRVSSGGDDSGIFNPDGTPMTVTNDIIFSDSIIRNASGGFSSAPRSLGPGNGGGTGGGQNRIWFRNVLIYALDQNLFGGSKGGDAIVYGSSGNTYTTCTGSRTSNIATANCPVGTVAPNPLSYISICGPTGTCTIPALQGGGTIPNGTVYVNFNGQREDPISPQTCVGGVCTPQLTGPCYLPDGVTVIPCGTMVFSGGTYDANWTTMIGAGVKPTYDCRTLPNCTNTQGTSNIWAPMCGGGTGASSAEIGEACHNCGSSGNSQCPPFGCGDVNCVSGAEFGTDVICTGTGATGCGPANTTFQTYAFSTLDISPGDIANVSGFSDATLNTPPEPVVPNIYAATAGVSQTLACGTITPTASQSATGLTLVYPNCGPNESGITGGQVNNAAGWARNFVVDHVALYTGGKAELDATLYGFKPQMENNQMTNSIFYFGSSGKGIYCGGGGAPCNFSEANLGSYFTWDQQTNQIHHNVFILPTETRANLYTAVGLNGSTICGPVATYPTAGNCTQYWTGSALAPMTVGCATLQVFDTNGVPECLGLGGFLGGTALGSGAGQFPSGDCTNGTISLCPLVSPPWGSFDYHNFALCTSCKAGGINFFSSSNTRNGAGTDTLQLGPCLLSSVLNCQSPSASMISIDNALSRKLYVCLNSCGTGPWPD